MPLPPKTLLTIPTRVVLLSGLLVGTLDILSAFVDYFISTGKNPLKVLPYIASGAFGPDALNGGTQMMIAGLIFHYLIAFAFTLLFFFIYPRSAAFRKNWVVTGILYGIFIWMIMNLIVVQNSGAPHAKISAMKPAKVAKSMSILICMIGLPLSFIAWRYSRRREERRSS